MNIKNYIAERNQRRQLREKQAYLDRNFAEFEIYLKTNPAYIGSRFDGLFTARYSPEQQNKFVSLLAAYPLSHARLYDRIGRFLQKQHNLDPALQLACCKMLTAGSQYLVFSETESLLQKSPLCQEARLFLLGFLRSHVVRKGDDVSSEEDSAARTVIGLLDGVSALPENEANFLFEMIEDMLPRHAPRCLWGLSAYICSHPPPALRAEAIRLVKRSFSHRPADAADYCLRLLANEGDKLSSAEIGDITTTTTRWLRYSLEEDEPWNRNRTAARLVDLAADRKMFGGSSRLALAFVAAAVNKGLIHPEAWPRGTYESWKAASELAALFATVNTGNNFAEKPQAALPPAPPSLQ